MVECPRCHAENGDDERFCGKCAAPLGKGGGAGLAGAIPETLEVPVVVLKPGSLVAGKYRIVQEAGAGGMGIVYKAEDLRLKRAVALKFLPPDLVDAPELKERFLVEAQAAAALSHPNICVVYEVGESEDRPYIAMEYVEGETLRDRIKRGPLPVDEALELALQIAAGLGEAHSKGILHRDVKSANVMVTEKGTAKVLDFGLAKLRDEGSLTKSQTTLGTVAYMSPEQSRGEKLDPRTDVWSLGVVLHEMVAGRLPFRGETDVAVMYSILYQEPEALTQARPGAPPGLEQVVRQALAKKPAERYQTMEELREDVSAVAGGLRPLRARPARRTVLGLRASYVYTALAALLALALGLNLGGVRDRLLGRGAPPAHIKLAVLPFLNLTGDPDQEHLSDGTTQEMITQLGRLHPEGLLVIARTSVMRYKDGATPVDQIGRELGVEYVLEGSARREANRVRITAELIRVLDQTQLWGDSYEREMSDILAVQNEVASNVARALALKLLPSEQARLAQARPVDPEAYEAYLRGSFHWTKFTPADLDIAERYFDLALEKDSSYAPAYAGRAWVWAVRNQFGIVPPDEAGPKAKAAALRAIELDEDLAGAHEVMAVAGAWGDWDWEAARESFRRAIELNPNVANAQAMYSHFLAVTGHGEEALEHGRRAVELDPFNPLVHSFYATLLYFQRRYDEAIAAAREALRFQPDHPLANSALWLAMHEKGMEDEAIRAAIACTNVTYNDPRIEAALEEGYGQGGYAEAMRRAADVLVSRLPEAYSLPFDIAVPYAMAGEKEETMEWLERGFDVHDPSMPYVGITPLLDIVRDDPRFQELLRRMNLPADPGR
jgi:eukaryotic-like serine/threonine-protein kinase